MGRSNRGSHHQVTVVNDGEVREKATKKERGTVNERDGWGFVLLGLGEREREWLSSTCG